MHSTHVRMKRLSGEEQNEEKMEGNITTVISMNTSVAFLIARPSIIALCIVFILPTACQAATGCPEL